MMIPSVLSGFQQWRPETSSQDQGSQAHWVFSSVRQQPQPSLCWSREGSVGAPQENQTQLPYFVDSACDNIILPRNKLL